MAGDGRVDVYGGVDTHRDVHVAAVVDNAGRVLGTAPFPADTAGYEQLGDWLRSQGRVMRVGVEATGSYGAGLMRHLTGVGVEVVEVNRPNRQLRRRLGKTDATDAQAAARSALNGQATTRPKTGDGPVEGIRMLGVARRSAVKARTQAINQLHALVVTAPEGVKHQLVGMSTKAKIDTCARFRPGTDHTTTTYAKKTLRFLARRYQALTAEINQLEVEINRLCARANPALLAATGIGAHTAATLLVAAGDNPERMHSESSFAALCGASPVQASSGRTVRHRLNRGGNRQANNALWRIATTRMRWDPTTIEYTKKTQGGRHNPPRGHPLPQTLYRPRGLPAAHQPTTNTGRRSTAHPTSPSPNHPHPRRPTTPHPPHPPITTRTRPLPQPPPRRPLPTMAHRTRSATKPDLTKIGASRRQPPSQQRSMADSHHPDAHRRRHQRICGQTTGRGQQANRDHPLPETSHRPRDLPPANQPVPNTAWQRSTPPTSPSPKNPHQRRRTTPGPPHPRITTRTRPPPQPPARYPISTMAKHPPKPDLQNIGASGAVQ